MASVDNLKSNLIEKILSIKNKEFLEALDKIVSAGNTLSDELELTEDQIKLLELSEKDIREGNTISQKAMFKRNEEWLNAI